MEISGQKPTWKDWWFNKVHGNTLIYNTCWEDPRADKIGLQLTPDAHILMITSAGCNALSYLLDDPASIDCVDVNPRQNALLDLKIALIRHGDYELLYQFFGEGVVKRPAELYIRHLRQFLPEASRQFWDGHMYYFNGKGLRKRFYLHGAAGLLAFLAARYLALHPGLKRDLLAVFDADNIETQRERYLHLEPRLFQQWLKPILKNHFTMSLAGVPTDQQVLAASTDPDGLYGYIKRSIRQVFTEVPASDNHFWRLYLDGHYTPGCCPEYLQEANFETLRERVDRISVHTHTLEGHLHRTQKSYTHFVLLDHQDWLARRNPNGLAEEWRAILQYAAPGARILMRSAGDQPDFIPSFAMDTMARRPQLEQEMMAHDRVGTYLSTWLMQLT